MNILTQYYSTPFGELLLGTYGDEVCLCDWRYRKQRDAIDQRVQRFLDSSYEEGESVVLTQLQRELNAYFEGTRNTFDVPLLFCGSEFQQRVWEELQRIPYGKTISYLELSRLLGNEKAIRAVATANGANAITILVPCHRVIGSKGELTGYAGGLNAKKRLLELEGALGQLDLF
ncbi:MAG: methylated-DNA--[protein]-cysteine S-methyltransferase [Flavobacteriales bacterium]|nr:methylated-DNA--[protein]-cysteine S-methyltransferase [Flavobacteriales bacterium]